MLDYFKTILSKVSFDRYLFEKELRKAIKALIPEEVEKLRDWCYREYSQLYRSILQKCFYQLN
jgi:hypothetical protein